ncbi:MAG: CpaF family protein [Pseudomonadota bacterium]
MKPSAPSPRRRPAARGGFGRAGLSRADDKGAGLARTKRTQKSDLVEQLADRFETNLDDWMTPEAAQGLTRGALAQSLNDYLISKLASENIELDEADLRDLITVLLNSFVELVGETEADPLDPVQIAKHNQSKTSENTDLEEAKDVIQPMLLEHIDATAANELERGELAEQITDVVSELLVQRKMNFNQKEQRDLVTLLLNDMMGLGPLEPLLADDTVTDIMVNGPQQIWVEQRGKLQLTGIQFRDNAHLLNIATRIVSAVGRRVDETSPICDARLMDGSRVNVVIPPLAIDGASISIRKFAKQKVTLDKMRDQGNISKNMERVLKIAGRCRLNILISGGTGSGKTTMLNALSQMIDPGERVVTIEDAAELQLLQPHVVRLETRPPNLEGKGEITMRDLVKNALRMRPDRIILGEIRGGEAIDMLQAMNTGHDGSLGTVHANRPREALTRLENMVNMAGMHLPSKAIRTQISDALHLIVQVARMRDGKRRVQAVTEVVGMEGDIITTQDLFVFKFTGEDANGELTGEFVSSGVRPNFYERAEYYGLGRTLMEAM